MGDQSDTAEPPQPPPRPLRAARRTSMQSSLPKKATGPSSASTQAGQSRRPSAASPAPTGSSEETEAGADTQPSGAKILPDSMTSAGSVLQESSTPLRKVGSTPLDSWADAQTFEPRSSIRTLLLAANTNPANAITSRAAAQSMERPQRGAPSFDGLSTITTFVATNLRADAQHNELHQASNIYSPPAANNEPFDTSNSRGLVLGLEDTAATSPPHLELLNITEAAYTIPSSGAQSPKPPAPIEFTSSGADAQNSESHQSTSKSSPLPSALQDPAPLSAVRRQNTPTSSTASSASATPSRPERLNQPEAIPTFQGVQAYMAGPPLPQSTPDNYTNPWVPYHPWAQYLTRRPIYGNLSEASVTSHLPAFVYRHLGPAGYFGRRYRSSDPDLPQSPEGPPPTLVYPPMRNGAFPALYQVVSKNHGQGVILEAKDFLIPGPDHQELHCIVLDQYAVNSLSQTRGFDRSQMSVKDFVWVQSIKPTRAALGDPEATLTGSRIPRVTAMDTRHPYFFRVHEFILVTPPSANEIVYGLVLEVPRRGVRNDRVNNIRIALEGCPEAITIAPKICEFNIADAQENQLLLAETRLNVSTAMRFSQLPVSEEAEEFLTNAVRTFLPAYPERAILPLRVFRPTPADQEWLQDRASQFSSYSKNKRDARKRMSKLFSVACAALSATTHATDDKSTHHVMASVPSLQAHPIRLQFELEGITSETGWNPQRPADVWIVGSDIVARMTIARASFDFARRITDVELHSTISCHRPLRRSIQQLGQTSPEAGIQVNMCVRLATLPTGTDPVFALLAEHQIFAALDGDSTARRAHQILDAVYDPQARLASSLPSLPPPPPALSVRVRNRNLALRDDQIRAVQMGVSDTPLLAIQAAFATGKTLVGAVIAATLAEADADHIVVATATTNAAVAQFTETLLSLSDFRNLPILRFVADSALREGTPTTSVDLHTVLRSLVTDFRDQLRPNEIKSLSAYARGRELIETTIFHPERTLELTDAERDRYFIAERENPDATEDAVLIMFRVRRPRILCMTTSALLNSTRPSGLFNSYLTETRILICDEASQIPEPVFVAMTSWFPDARMILIGDVHQLAPHIRCARTSTAAIHGARGAMNLLLSKDVPVAPLLTTFRAHPALNGLPNSLFYEGRLVSGTPERQRRMLTDLLRLPNPQVPFLLVHVEGMSTRSAGGSHSNEAEARYCCEIIQALLARGISPTSLAIVTFYKEQARLLQDYAARQGVAIHTVDSVQGREFDIVILLTTRSDVDPDTSNFLDDPLRMNVALTRCRHGQIVLGNITALRILRNWACVLHWAQGHRVFIRTSTLEDILS